MRKISILMTFFVVMLSAPALAGTVSCEDTQTDLVVVIQNADELARGQAALATYKYFYGETESDPEQTASMGFGSGKENRNGVRSEYHYTLIVLKLPQEVGGFTSGMYTVSSNGSRTFSSDRLNLTCYLNR